MFLLTPEWRRNPDDIHSHLLNSRLVSKSIGWAPQRAHRGKEHTEEKGSGQ